MKAFWWIGLPIVNDEGGNFLCRFKDVLAAVLYPLQRLRAHPLKMRAESLPSMAIGCAK
jgi:hypothetical protein